MFYLCRKAYKQGSLHKKGPHAVRSMRVTPPRCIGWGSFIRVCLTVPQPCREQPAPLPLMGPRPRAAGSGHRGAGQPLPKAALNAHCGNLTAP